MSKETLKHERDALRAAALARRDGLSVEARIEASMEVAAHGAAALDIAPGAIVSGFMPIRSEVDVRPLMAHLREAGARLCLPVVSDRETIVFRDLVRGAPLVDTGFGTTGPAADAEELQPQVMLVPLAAFDAAGNRLGYGAGHYDRAIARLEAAGLRPLLIGVGFACQEVEAIAAEDHDAPLDCILTERGLRHFRAAR